MKNGLKKLGLLLLFIQNICFGSSLTYFVTTDDLGDPGDILTSDGNAPAIFVPPGLIDVGSATEALQLYLNDNGVNADYPLIFGSNSSGYSDLYTNSAGLYYNPYTHILNALYFSGNGSELTNLNPSHLSAVVPLSLGGTGADLSATGGTSQVLKQNTAGGSITVGQLAASNLSNGTTGSGSVVLSTSPSLTTPSLGSATATSINNVSIIQPTLPAIINLAQGSALQTTGSYTINLTATGSTSVTLPTSGTLVNTTVSDLSNLSTIGTITSGTWNGASISASYGGTGLSSYSTGDLLYASSASALSKLNLGSSGNILTAGSSAPQWSSTSAISVGSATNIAGGSSNQIPYQTGSNATSFISAVANSILATNGLSVPSLTSTLPSAVQGNITSTGTLSSGTWQANTIGLAYGGTGSNLSATGGTSQVLKQTSAGGAISVGQISASDLSNGTNGSGLVVLSTSPSLTTPTLGSATATSINNVAITQPLSTSTLNLASGSTFQTTGAYTTNITSTAATSVTLPTSGTLVNTSVSTLSSLASIGTITTGTWNGTAIGVGYGGTNLTSYTIGDLLYASGTSTLAKLGIGANGSVLTSDGTSPTYTAQSSLSVGKSTNIAGGTANQIPYQTAADTTSFISAAANDILATNGSNTPALTATLPSQVQNNITALGTIGQQVNISYAASSNPVLNLNNTSASNPTNLRLTNVNSNYWSLSNTSSNAFQLLYNGTQFSSWDTSGNLTLGNNTTLSNLILSISNGAGSGSTGYVNGLSVGSYNGGGLYFVTNGSASSYHGISNNQTGLAISFGKDFVITTGSSNNNESEVMRVKTDGVLSLQKTIATPNASCVAITTGGSATAADHSGGYNMCPSGTIASYTLTLPTSPDSGENFTISTTKAITSFTIVGTTNYSPTTLAAGAVIWYFYNSSSSQWQYGRAS